MYKSTYTEKKVIKLAPDAVVKVNGDFRIKICPKCGATINLSDYIISVSSSLPINTTIGNAQFTISMPRHGVDGNFMVRGGKVYGIELMDEIEIYIKGRYPTDRSNDYPYYKVFWGIVTNIGESYNNGVQEISVSCESMLKWFQLMRTNIHPANLQQEDIVDEKVSQRDRSAWSGVNYVGWTPYEIIYDLTKVTMNNMVLPGKYDTEKPFEDAKDLNGNPISDRRFYSGSERSRIEKTIISKWQERFKSIRNALKMFGTTEESFNDRTNSNLVEIQNKTLGESGGQLGASKTKTTASDIRINSKALMDFTPYGFRKESPDLPNVTSTYKTNLEIINEIKLLTGYEFYLDSNGDIIFKPPFWNLDTAKNPVYNIKNSDIVSWDFQESEEEVVTRVEVTGNLSNVVFFENSEGLAGPVGIFTNYNLSRKFGIREHPLTMSMLLTSNQCYHHAIDEMDRINANIYRGSLTIVGRPELRLGYPVYIEGRDIYGYIENISHNFTFGGPYTTQIHLVAIRKKYISNDTASEGYVFENDNSRNIKGDSVVLIFDKTTNFLNTLDSSKESEEIKKRTPKTQAEHNKPNPEDLDKVSNLKTNRAGEYKEVSLNHPDAQKILEKLDLAKKSDNTNSYLNLLDKMIPVSDERGYELIGIYEYGRTLYLSRDGTIKKKANSFSQLLADSLKKIDKLSDYSGNSSFTEFTVVEEPKETTGTLSKEGSVDINKNSNTVKEVSNFNSYKSFRLSEIAPNRDKAINKGCSCHDPGLNKLSYADNVALNKQKTMANLNRK